MPFWAVFAAVAGFSGTGWTETGRVSWYSVEACRWNPAPSCPTASGASLYELEKKGVLFAAMWDVPFGSRWRVCDPDNGKCVEVVILDRGPARRLNRRIDLCREAFSRIGNLKKGVMSVTVERVG